MQIFRLIAGWLALTVSAQAVVFNLVAPPTPVAVGAEMRLNLLILNPGDQETVLELPTGSSRFVVGSG